ncbi:MAG TPA: hypothetical protein VG860_09130 [Terriglobia bacterium]|jgi:hypothetical protein|nr:hypothetical protein [Terriglobia bacterium]
MSRRSAIPAAAILVVSAMLLLSLTALGQRAPRSGQSGLTIPSYCNPCLEYAGDFDPNNAQANGLANSCTLDYDCSDPSESNIVYVPFTVPVGQQWQVSGLFTNNISTVSVIDPPEAYWSISILKKAGQPNEVLYEGTSPASFTLTGMGAPLINVYNVLVKNIKTPTGGPIVLKAGRYWLAVVPQCTNASDSACSSAEYFAADVEDMPPPNQFGPPEPWDDSFFYSATFGFDYEPTWGPSGPCSGVGCDAFSAGVVGKAMPDDGPAE